jgi:hypothetical protein
VKTPAVSFLVFSVLINPSVIRAQWQADGNALSTDLNNQERHAMVADGSGGAIVAWLDNRNGGWDIFAQRVNAFGMVQWAADGDTLCSAAGDQEFVTIASDGAGGAIVAWQDRRTAVLNIYAQRVNALGVAQWTANGVVVCAAAGHQYIPAIVSDGAGGAIVAWYDARNFNLDIYVQRMNASGVAQWTADGVALCTAVGSQYYPQIVSDGAGGAIVTWQDDRAAPLGPDIYARRVNAAGVAQWTANGVALSTQTDDQSYPSLVPDGAGGAIVAWLDYRSSGPGIYAQRVDALGAVQWPGDGVALGTTAGEPYPPAIMSDGAGGAIATWNEVYVDTTIHAQWVDGAGAVQWGANGSGLCTAVNDRLYPAIAPDGAGGAIVAWTDYRNGNPNSDIYAQRVNPSGTPQWVADGDTVCTAPGHQGNSLIVSDGAGGAIVTWSDHRSGNSDIYALRIGPGGVPTAVRAAPAAGAVMLSRNYPNPFNTETAFEITLHRDATVTAEVFDAAGRRVRKSNVGRVGAGTSRLTFDGTDDRGRPLASGVYFYRVRAGSETVTRKVLIAR